MMILGKIPCRNSSVGLEGKAAVKCNAINDRLQAINLEVSNLRQSAKDISDKKPIIEKLNSVCNKVEGTKEENTDTLWATIYRYKETIDVIPLSRK